MKRRAFNYHARRRGIHLASEDVWSLKQRTSATGRLYRKDTRRRTDKKMTSTRSSSRSEQWAPSLGTGCSSPGPQPVTLRGSLTAAIFSKGRRRHPAESPPGQVAFLKSHLYRCLSGMLAPTGFNSCGQVFRTMDNTMPAKRCSLEAPHFRWGQDWTMSFKSPADSLPELSYSLYPQRPAWQTLHEPKHRGFSGAGGSQEGSQGVIFP